MEVIYLFVFSAFALYFTKCAIKITYEDSKRLSKICATVFWICTVAQIVKMINL